MFKEFNNYQKTIVLGKLNCYTNFSLSAISPIKYELSQAQFVYDCNGKRIAYEPKIIIDPVLGVLVSQEKLSRENYCDATFLIKVQREEIIKEGLSLRYPQF